MNLKEQRAALLAQAQSIASKAKAANRDLTATEVAGIEQHVTDIQALDAKIKATEDGQAAIKALGHVDPDEVHGPDGEVISSGVKSGRLDLSNLTERMVKGMTTESARGGLTKGLTVGGATVVDRLVVNTDPIKAAAALERAPRLLDMLTAVARPGPVYSFLQQVVVASPGAAGVVASGAVKPTKKLGVARLDADLKVVAVLSEPVDKFLLEDAGSLTTWVGTELGEAVKDAIEAQILTGSGSGGNFQGLATLVGTQAQTFATDKIITVQSGISKLEAIGIAPAFVALSSADWLAIQTARTTGGSFDVGGPIDSTARTLWGVPVALVGGLAAGAGYVVGADSIALSTDSNGIRAEWGTPGDAFTRNQLVARVEGRFNLDAMRPHGVVKLALTGA